MISYPRSVSIKVLMLVVKLYEIQYVELVGRLHVSCDYEHVLFLNFFMAAAATINNLPVLYGTIIFIIPYCTLVGIMHAVFIIIHAYHTELNKSYLSSVNRPDLHDNCHQSIARLARTADCG